MIEKHYTDLVNKATLWLEHRLNVILTSKYNPLYFHGALPQFCLWILFLSGLLLFAYYIPTVGNAYASPKLINAWTSVDYVTKTIPFGAVVRGLHRYAGDALIITIVLHMLRVWFTDRYRQYRIVQWLSGVVLLLSVLVIGQTGYLLVFDDRSLVLTRMTASAFESLPFVGTPLKDWFLNGSEVTNLTLSNFLSIHIGLSFALLVGLWVHYLRMQRPLITPPPVISYVLLSILFLVVACLPIESGKMAQLTQEPQAFDLDWFFLLPYFLMAKVPLLGFWLMMLASIALLCSMPYWQRTKPVEAAEVVMDKCTGCSLCARDCPYNAIEMVPAPTWSRFKLLATVKPYRCSGCGVCVGACAFDAIDLLDLLDTDITARIKSLSQS